MVRGITEVANGINHSNTLLTNGATTSGQAISTPTIPNGDHRFLLGAPSS